MQTRFLGGIRVKDLTLSVMKIKLLYLQEFINEKKREYGAMHLLDIGEQAFIDGVMAACEFFEEVLDDVLGTKAELEKILNEFDEIE
jgi:hypothetical protein